MVRIRQTGATARALRSSIPGPSKEASMGASRALCVGLLKAGTRRGLLRRQRCLPAGGRSSAACREAPQTRPVSAAVAVLCISDSATDDGRSRWPPRQHSHAQRGRRSQEMKQHEQVPVGEAAQRACALKLPVEWPIGVRFSCPGPVISIAPSS